MKESNSCGLGLMEVLTCGLGWQAACDAVLDGAGNFDARVLAELEPVDGDAPASECGVKRARSGAALAGRKRARRESSWEPLGLVRDAFVGESEMWVIVDALDSDSERLGSDSEVEQELVLVIESDSDSDEAGSQSELEDGEWGGEARSVPGEGERGREAAPGNVDQRAAGLAGLLAALVEGRAGVGGVDGAAALALAGEIEAEVHRASAAAGLPRYLASVARVADMLRVDCVARFVLSHDITAKVLCDATLKAADPSASDAWSSMLSGLDS